MQKKKLARVRFTMSEKSLYSVVLLQINNQQKKIK